MSVVWMESWGHFRDHDDLGARYTLEGAGAANGNNIEILPTGGPTHTAAGPQFPRGPVPGCIRFKGNLGINQVTRVKIDVTPRDEYIVGFNFLWEGVNPVETHSRDTILFFYDNAGGPQEQVTVELVPDGFKFETDRGHMRVELGYNSSSFFWDSKDDAENADDSDVHTFIYNRWYYVEIRVKISDTLGELEVRVDGVEWFKTANIDTKPLSATLIDQIWLSSADRFPNSSVGSGAIYRITDLWIVDPAGGGNEIGFLYPAVIDVLRPSAEVVGEIDFTPQTGIDNSAMVDEVQHDFDTTYNEANVATNKDRFDTAGSVPESTFGDVKAVQVQAIAKDTLDTGTRTFRVVIFEGVTEGVGATQTLTETKWQSVYHLYEDNPDTVAAWLMADVELAEIGYEIVL